MEKLKCAHRYAILAVVLFIVIPLSACRPEPVAPDDARVVILQPSADSVLSSNSVFIRTYVEYFSLVDKIGQVNQPGEGHLIYYMDVTPPTVKGRSALTAKDTYIISTQKSFTWENVITGQHSFWVQLVNNDNTVLEPPAAVRVPVTVIRN
jgi:hypothetical protein